MVDIILITSFIIIFSVTFYVIRKKSNKFRQEEFDRLNEDENEMD